MIFRSSSMAHHDAFPVMKVANGLKLVIHDTNAAIMTAIDGEEGFADEVEEQLSLFRSMLNDMESSPKVEESIKEIREHYDIYSEKGLRFGKRSLAGTDTVEDLIQLTALRQDLTEKVEAFQRRYEDVFEKSLEEVKHGSRNFQRLFLISALVLAILLLVLILMVQSMLGSIQRLKEHAVNLSQGDLEHEMTTDKQDELGVLQSSFEAMRVHLRDYIQNLDKKVNERTQELKKSQEELEKSREEALKASESKGVFLANMSHEIRTPLSAIIGFGQLIRESAQGVSRELSDHLQHIESAGLHLKEVIGNILDLSKIEQGKIDPQMSDFELRGLIKKVYGINRGMALEKDVNYNLQIDESIPKYIRSDSTLVQQVTMNLINNAIKFTPSGKSVSLQVNQKGEELVISVKDEGIGLNEEQLERVFEPFEQADNSTRRQFGGTGLGLPITKEICSLLGGGVEAESELGVGSTFTATIPLIPVETAASETKEAHFRKDLNVMVIDDNGTNLALMKSVLKKLSFNVDSHLSGQSGLDALTSSKPDLIILDLHMPEMDGFEFLNEIPKEERPITFMCSADVFTETVEQSKELGVEEFLTKPLDLHALKEALARRFPVE